MKSATKVKGVTNTQLGVATLALMLSLNIALVALPVKSKKANIKQKPNCIEVITSLPNEDRSSLSTIKACCPKRDQCATQGQGCINFDTIHNGMVCGANNDWNACGSDLTKKIALKGGVSDGGKYRCNGVAWQFNQDLSIKLNNERAQDSIRNDRPFRNYYLPRFDLLNHSTTPVSDIHINDNVLLSFEYLIRGTLENNEFISPHYMAYGVSENEPNVSSQRSGALMNSLLPVYTSKYQFTTGTYSYQNQNFIGYYINTQPGEVIELTPMNEDEPRQVVSAQRVFINLDRNRSFKFALDNSVTTDGFRKLRFVTKPQSCSDGQTLVDSTLDGEKSSQVVRRACCPISSQCVTRTGECVDIGTKNGNFICGNRNKWEGCGREVQGDIKKIENQISDSHTFICRDQEWRSCNPTKLILTDVLIDTNYLNPTDEEIRANFQKASNVLCLQSSNNDIGIQLRRIIKARVPNDIPNRDFVASFYQNQTPPEYFVWVGSARWTSRDANPAQQSGRTMHFVLDDNYCNRFVGMFGQHSMHAAGVKWNTFGRNRFYDVVIHELLHQFRKGDHFEEALCQGRITNDNYEGRTDTIYGICPDGLATFEQSFSNCPNNNRMSRILSLPEEVIHRDTDAHLGPLQHENIGLPGQLR